MKYCSHCGAEIMDEAEICVHCGCRVANKSNSNYDTMSTVIKIFMILGTVVVGLCTFFIGLAWCIPMTMSVNKKLNNHEPVGVGMKVCTLLLVNTIAGILLFCLNDN